MPCTAIRTADRRFFELVIAMDASNDVHVAQSFFGVGLRAA